MVNEIWKKKNIWSNLIFLFYVFTCSMQQNCGTFKLPLVLNLNSTGHPNIDVPYSTIVRTCYNKHPEFNYDQEKIAAVLWCKWNLTKHSVYWNFNTSFLDVFDILFSKVFWFYCPRLSIELMDDVTYNFYKKNDEFI